MTRERNLNFSQREGLSPLPIAYELEELSYEVRNEIKYILEEELNKYFGFYRHVGEDFYPIGYILISLPLHIWD